MLKPPEHDAVTRGHDLLSGEMMLDPIEENLHQVMDGGLVLYRQRPGDLRTFIVAGMEARPRPDPLDLSLHETFSAAGRAIHGELDAGRARIENEHDIRSRGALYPNSPCVHFHRIPRPTRQTDGLVATPPALRLCPK